MNESIKYPYLPENRQFLFVPADHKYMIMAKEYARENALDKTMPSTVVIAKDDTVLGIGANGSDYHEKNACNRVELGCQTGEGYDLCEGCHPKNHSETTAINDAIENGNDFLDADLYLWGHWWCCEPCWEKIIEVGINNIYLLEKSEILFNKDHPDNIIGKQFE